MDKDKQRRRSLASVSNYQVTFTSDVGKRVLWDLMKLCNVTASSFELDPNMTAFNEGKRSVALHILQKLNTDVKHLETIIEEGNDYDRELWGD